MLSAAEIIERLWSVRMLRAQGALNSRVIEPYSRKPRFYFKE